MASANKNQKAKETQKGMPSWLPGLVIFLSSFFVYANTISNQYALDDSIAIGRNQFTRMGFDGISKHLTNEAFTGFFGYRSTLVEGGRYRPLSFITFSIEEGLFNNPEVKADYTLNYETASNPSLASIRHFTNILLFALCCWLLYKVLLSFLGSGTAGPWFSAAFIGSLLFALHPIHTEVVANIKGRDEILVLLFGMLTLLYAIRIPLEQENKKYISAGLIFVAFYLGLLSKENAATFLGIVPLALWVFRKATAKDFAIVMVPMLLASGIYYLQRASALKLTPEETQKMEAAKKETDPAKKDSPGLQEILNDPWIGVSGSVRFGTVCKTFGKYMQLLVVPHPLTHDYYPWQIPLTEPGSLSALIPFLLALVLLGYGIVECIRKKPIGFAILFFFLTFSVVSNLVVSIGTLMGERFVFLSSVGFCMAIGILIAALLSKITSPSVRNFAVAGLIGIPVVGFTAKTILRNPVWKDDMTLALNDAKISTQSTKVLTFAGGKLYDTAIIPGTDPSEKAWKLDTAEKYLDRALKIYPENHNALLLLGNIYFEKNQKLDQAVANYLKILEKRPNYADAVNNLKAVVTKGKKSKLSPKPFLAYLKNHPEDYKIWHSYSLTLRDRNQVDSAIAAIENGLKANPKYGEGWAELGNYYGQFKNDLPKAIEQYAKAKETGYKEDGYYQNYGIAYAFSKDHQQAIAIFNEGLKYFPNSKDLYANLSLAYREIGDSANSASHWQKALQLGFKNPQ